jgi:NhaP-type Na+/H+ or K+/H+ antiporter
MCLYTVLHAQAIEQDTRDLILFFTAGITALTLVIDGTLAKPLLSRLGMDRSITAETEVAVTEALQIGGSILYVVILQSYRPVSCYCSAFCMCILM